MLQHHCVVNVGIVLPHHQRQSREDIDVLVFQVQPQTGDEISFEVVDAQIKAGVEQLIRHLRPFQQLAVVVEMHQRLNTLLVVFGRLAVLLVGDDKLNKLANQLVEEHGKVL